MSNSWIDGGGGAGIYCDADADNNLLQLKLKKPDAWKWELTTSRSSPNIALPRIMLFDHEGTLLVDANQQVDDATYRAEKNVLKVPKRRTKKFNRAATTNLEKSIQDDEDTGLGSLDSTEKQWFKPLSNDSLKFKRKPSILRNSQRADHIPKSWRYSAPNEIDFESLEICDATESNPRSPLQFYGSAITSSASPSPLHICEVTDSNTQSPFEYQKDQEEDSNLDTPWRRKLSLQSKHIESPEIVRRELQNYPLILSDTEETPERQYVSKATWKPFHSNGCLNVTKPSSKHFERRATSFKEVRFNVQPEAENSEEQRTKRRFRRSNSNSLPSLTHSRSILERQSAMKCRLSSPEFESAESHEIEMGPRYFLRSSRAGTLVVADETAKHRRNRRRLPKTSSTENVLSHSSSSVKQKGLLNTGLGDPCSQSQSVKNFGELNGNQRRRKIVPIRRNRSDGNILLVSSSSEEHLKSCDNSKYRRKGIWQQINGDVQRQRNCYE